MFTFGIDKFIECWKMVSIQTSRTKLLQNEVILIYAYLVYLLIFIIGGHECVDCKKLKIIKYLADVKRFIIDTK